MRQIVIATIFLILMGCHKGEIVPSPATAGTLQRITIVPMVSPRFYVVLTDHETARLPSVNILRDPEFSNSFIARFADTAVAISNIINLKPGAKTPSKAMGYTESAHSPRWMPTIKYADTAAHTLKQDGYLNIAIADTYSTLPTADGKIKGENKRENDQVNRWYYEEVSTTKYGMDYVVSADAVIELGMLTYCYMDSHLMLQVAVKVVNPATKKVIGRARHMERVRADIVKLLDKDDAEEFRQLIITTGNKGVDDCLRHLGLAGHGGGRR